MFSEPQEISQFAGHGAFFGMHLADAAPHPIPPQFRGKQTRWTTMALTP
jgi:hypothetical protein